MILVFRNLYHFINIFSVFGIIYTAFAMRTVLRINTYNIPLIIIRVAGNIKKSALVSLSVKIDGKLTSTAFLALAFNKCN
jgi:hypothetical protein